MTKFIQKIKIVTLAIGITFAIAPLSSCKKYDEGPYLSLRSKTERAANTWKAEKVTEGGKDETSSYSEVRVTLTKGGDYTITSGKGIFSMPATGTWSFVNDKEDIQTTSDPILGASKVKTFHIIKLMESQLWVREGDTEFHLIPA